MGGDHARLHHRTSTRKVDDLVKALGCDSGISKSTVSRICKAIDDDVAVMRDRRLDHQPVRVRVARRDLVHVRDHGQVVSRAVVIATGCRADGYRKILGVDLGNSENETFCTQFLRGLVVRGLHGVRLVIFDAHAGLINAIRRVVQDQQLAKVIRQHACSAGTGVPAGHLRRWERPWQRDLRGLAADPSLPAVAGLDRPVGVVPRAPG